MMEERALLAGIALEASTFSISQFESNVHEQAGQPDDPSSMNVVGYSYFLSQRENGFPLEGVTAQGGIGFARTSVDGELERNVFTRHEIASATKPITAAAILQILQNQATTETPIEDLLNQTIEQFLPSTWTVQTWVSNVTIRELLSHRSGMGQNETSPVRSDTNLMTQLNTPGFMPLESDPTATDYGYFYTSTNYAIFRVMLPYIWNFNIGDEGNLVDDVLDPVANGDPSAVQNLPQTIQDAIAQDYDLSNITQTQLTAALYKYYVAENVLKPADILNPNTLNLDPEPNDSVPEQTLIYQFPGSTAGFDTADQTELAGSRGWNLSAADLDKFLSVLRYTETILNDQTRDLMLTNNLGWRDGDVTSGMYGTYFGHNGSTTLSDGSSGGQTNTQVMNYPKNVQASLTINSSLDTDFGSSFNPAGNNRGLFATLNEAYDNAWTELVYNGYSQADAENVENLISSANDTFTLRTNQTDPAYIDIVHSAVGLFGSPFIVSTITRRADTLQKLTINGLGGFDVYNIETLPSHMQLIINGGDNQDYVYLGAGGNDLDNNTRGVLNFDGAGGSDLLRVEDGGEEGVGRVYAISNTNVTRTFDALPFVLEYQHKNVETLTLNSSQQADIIIVNTSPAGPTVIVNAGDGNDVIQGGSAADVLNGDEGNDTIFGAGGKDVIHGGIGNDTIDGGNGNDVIVGGPGNDYADGGSGNDYLHGDAGQDTLIGGAGFDVLEGGWDSDTLFGDSGNDHLYGGYITAVVGQFMDYSVDFLDGGSGVDGILGDNGDLNLATFNISLPGGGGDFILGGTGGDLIYGQDGNDWIQGNGGNDTIFGQGGRDIIFGGSIVCLPDRDPNEPNRDSDDEHDQRNGEDERLDPPRRDDRRFEGCFEEFRQPTPPDQRDPDQGPPPGVAPFAADGSDDIDAGSGSDLIYGDNWSQSFEEYTGGGAGDELLGNIGDDFMFGQVGADTMHGNAGRDVMLGGDGKDEMNGDEDSDWMAGQVGADQMYGGQGNDVMFGGEGQDGLRGGPDNDLLQGGNGADDLWGDSGNDTLQGGSGNDGLVGGPGADWLQGEEGQDLLIGGNFGPEPESDNDLLQGGAGNDTLFGDTLITFTEFDASAGGTDELDGGDGQDIMYGQVGHDMMRGGIGNDLMHGGPGNDQIFGEDGSDTINGDDGSDTIFGQDGNDVVNGGDGDDLIDGSAHRDYLNGNAGNDIIRGGDHSDTLLGAAGNDILLGEGGNDDLSGGDDNDVLIGGRNSDTLDGGGGQDILIGGTTIHDSSNNALKHIIAEWTSARPFVTRVRNMIGQNNPQFANRLNANFFLIPTGNAATVQDDGAIDSLFGGTEQDWFLPDGIDNILDAMLGDVVTTVGP